MTALGTGYVLQRESTATNIERGWFIVQIPQGVYTAPALGIYPGLAVGGAVGGTIAGQGGGVAIF